MESLTQRINQALNPGEMSNHLENAHDSHDSNQSDDLASFPNDLHVLQALQHHTKEEGHDCQQIDEVHFVPEKV